MTDESEAPEPRPQKQPARPWPKGAWRLALIGSYALLAILLAVIIAGMLGAFTSDGAPMSGRYTGTAVIFCGLIALMIRTLRRDRPRD